MLNPRIISLLSWYYYFALLIFFLQVLHIVMVLQRRSQSMAHITVRVIPRLLVWSHQINEMRGRE